jgi:hypothetical protein
MPVDPVAVNDIVSTPFGKMKVTLISKVNTTTAAAATIRLSEEQDQNQQDQNQLMYTGTLLNWTLANNQSVIYIYVYIYINFI